VGNGLSLKVYRGEELLRTEPLGPGVVKIGRLASATVRLDDDRVSRIHSVIEVAKDGRISIVDMGSAAGTFVNGERVARGALAAGDEITLGGIRIVVERAAPVGNHARNVAAPPRMTVPGNATIVAPAAPPAPPADPAEDAAEEALPEGTLGAELRLYWGETLLEARTFVGDGGLALAGLDEVAPAVHHVGGEYAIVPPGGVELPLREGSPVELALPGGLRVEARLRAAPPPAEASWWERTNFRFVNLVLLLAFLGGAFVVLARGALPRDAARPAPPPDDPLRLARFVAPPPPAAKPKPEPKVARGEIPKADKQKPGEAGERHRGAEGQMGKKDAPKVQARSAPKAIDPDDKEMVKQSGLLAVLGNGKGAPEGLSTVLGRGGLGGDLKGAIGNMFGATVGDSFGYAGLGLKGTGQGGGGSGETIGIGAVGTKGRGGGMGGYGSGVGGLGTKADRNIGLATADAKVMGAIDPELIRKVIRDHASQVRYCYEQQLALQPKLAGKVAIRWQIDASGRASATQVEAAETTLPSSEVHRCIMDRIVTWQFPKPKGGGVAIVKYPWILRTSGGAEPPGA
jgi:pSer/pThr/pTyr-binding forkhead associated (FHA) protein